MPSNTPLMHPQSYFREQQDTALHGVGVFALHVVGMIVMIYALKELLLAHSTNVPDAAVRAMNDVIVGTVLLSIPIAIVSLLVVAGFMHWWCRSDYHDSYLAAVGVAAWSYAPDLLAVPANYALAWFQFRGRTFDAADPEQFTAELEALQASGGIGDLLLALIVVAWSVYILAFGIAATHDVDVDESLTPALIVGFVSLILRVMAMV